VKGAKGCFSYATGHLAPYKLVLSLLEKAITQGVNLQTHTPVTAVSKAPENAGKKWLVSTSRGDILTNTVIHASNGYASALVPELRGKIVPARGICCRIIPQNPVIWSDRSYMLRHNDWEYDYLISRNDGSIVVGGARRDFYKDLDTWFDNTDDSALIEPAKRYFNGYMQRTFKGWDQSLASVDKIWTGSKCSSLPASTRSNLLQLVMGYSNDSSPYVGEVPGRSGQYVCAGFSGHGMPQVFLSAEAIASMVVDGESFEDTELPSLFQVTTDRLRSQVEHTSLAGWKAVMQRPSPKL
jgi:glycine/D-amino acid oxidase-like deaminating enzyme